MFATIKQIFKTSNKELRKKILFTLISLFIFKLGTTIIVPYIAKNNIVPGDLGFLELLNVMNGGGLQTFSIFALGVMPYINASIIIQLLQMDIVPYLSDLAKEGHTGRTKLNAITRVLGIVLAFIQGYIFALNYIKTGNVAVYIECAVVLTAGTAFLLWLGDQITVKGIGNGTSLIIMSGIISSLPTMFVGAYKAMVSTNFNIGGIIQFVIYVLMYFAIIVGVVYEQIAERRIPIQYANRSSSNFGNNQNYMPFKINSAGVMPVIFASALISIVGIIGSLIKNDNFTNFINNYINYSSVTGFILYMIVIIGFTYFFTFVQLKPKEMTENLQKNGGYIPGIRPGDDTLKYVNTVLYRITFIGAIALALLAGIPIIFGNFSGLNANITLGGTGLLIVVGVALETYKQLESQLVTKTYKRGRK